jgi:hypothetical protein
MSGPALSIVALDESADQVDSQASGVVSRPKPTMPELVVSGLVP